MVKDIAIYFTTIMLEAIPFLLLGAIISAVIEVFVSEEKLSRMIPKNRVLGSLTGVLMGFVLPACDCAVIPVAMRLKKKNVPTNVIVSFMLASPIINPVVLLSTFFAFLGKESIVLLGLTIPKLFIYRTILGIVLALLIGIIVDALMGDNILKNKEKENEKAADSKKNIEDEIADFVCSHGHVHGVGCACSQVNIDKEDNSIKGRIRQVSNVAYSDFFGILVFMIMGAFIASLAQVLIDFKSIATITNNGYIMSLVMMTFAFLLSLCSTSDSFIARTFVDSVSQNSILAFILLGPMIDIKNAIVLNKSFNKRFVVTLITTIFIVVYVASVIVKI